MSVAVRPFLMFEGKAEEAMQTVRVPRAREARSSTSRAYGPGGPGKEGTVMRGIFSVAGQVVQCTDSAMHHAFTFTPSFSFFVDCESEAQLDSSVADAVRRRRRDDAARQLRLQPAVRLAERPLRRVVAVESAVGLPHLRERGEHRLRRGDAGRCGRRFHRQRGVEAAHHLLGVLHLRERTRVDVRAVRPQRCGPPPTARSTRRAPRHRHRGGAPRTAGRAPSDRSRPKGTRYLDDSIFARRRPAAAVGAGAELRVPRQELQRVGGVGDGVHPAATGSNPRRSFSRAK